MHGTAFETDAIAATDAGAAGSRTTRPLKVLIIEDTPVDAELAVATLQRQWPDLAAEVVDNEPAFVAALARNPDIIISDFSVPSFGALRALNLLREGNITLPLIVLTGAVTEETVVQCIREGASDYLLKDRLTRLCPAVENALRMHDERLQKGAALAAREQLEQRYRSLFFNHPDTILEFGLDGRLVSGNAVAATLCGQPMEKLRGAHYSSLVGEQDLPSVRSAFEAAASGTSRTIEGMFRGKAGADVPVRLTTIPIVIDGHIVGTYCIAKDITDQKHAEERLRISASALRQLSEGVIILDAALRTITVNRAFSTMTGYPVHEVIGLSLAAFVTGANAELLVNEIRGTVDRMGRWRGEVRITRKDGTEFPVLFSFAAIRDPERKVEHYTAVLNDLSSFREFEQRIEYLGRHDDLTGLANRIVLEEQVHLAAATIENGTESAILLLLDLDGFKIFNETLGRSFGNALLRSIADRLRSVHAPDDLLVRLAGDEFAIFTMHPLHTRDPLTFAARVQAALSDPFRIDDREIAITASIGIGQLPGDGYDFESLLRAADAAVYRAKVKGRNSIVTYSPDTGVAAMERLTLQTSLRNALARDELFLEYQPIMDLGSSRIAAAEALIRWRHPELGLVSPARFIPLAEDTGDIIAIGAWVLDTAAKQVRSWIDAGWADARVSVNLSARQFGQPDLAQLIVRSLKDAAIDARHLHVEVTESMIMTDVASAQRVLQELSEAGIAIAIDDFGTGHSSLSYLQRFPLDYLKIDRSFLENVPGHAGNEAIVRAIIALGRNLGLKIVAEGVETVDQIRFLSSTSCDLGQGYYFHKPLSAAGVLDVARGD